MYKTTRINKLKTCLGPKYKMLDIVPTIVSYTEKSFDVDVLEGKFKFINNERHHHSTSTSLQIELSKSFRLHPDLAKLSRAAFIENCLTFIFLFCSEIWSILLERRRYYVNMNPRGSLLGERIFNISLLLCGGIVVPA